jgi:hypothetical protein
MFFIIVSHEECLNTETSFKININFSLINELKLILTNFWKK